MSRWPLTDNLEFDEDPRWVYDLTIEQAYAAWPCGDCDTRRDEHADQSIQSRFPELDITDHDFVEVYTPSLEVEDGDD